VAALLTKILVLQHHPAGGALPRRLRVHAEEEDWIREGDMKLNL
jgi:hypothetical protein